MCYEAAFAAAAELGDVFCLLDCTIHLGHGYRQAGGRELAAEYFELALTLAGLWGRDPVASRAMNGLGLLDYMDGDLSAAEDKYAQARALAQRCADEHILGEIDQNLGILATIRGDARTALSWYEAALRHHRAAGSDAGIAGVLNNLGMLHVDLGRLDEAAAYFEEALYFASRLPTERVAGMIYLSRAELLLARDLPEQARESCDEGFEIFSRISDVAGRAEALKFYGIIYRRTGKPHLAIVHLNEAIGVAKTRDALLEAEAQRELGLVLRQQGRNRDAMEALNRAHALFSTLQATPDHADVSERIAQIEADFLTLVQVWGESIEVKDRYTSGHCRRVADYACRIAEDTGFPAREMVWFRMGAFLHDLGKTEVPAEILNKPGRLTDEERRVMERHTVIGDEMLAHVEFPWDVRPMVRSHHERWDGGGYPDGLHARAIPVAARILRIADIFDALTTTRSYRRPLSPEEALGIMADDAGSFDPELFERFRRLFPELAKIALEAQAGAAVPVAESS